MGKGRRRGYNDFSLRKRWVCCVVENLFRVFLSKIASFAFVGNGGIYSMGEE